MAFMHRPWRIIGGILVLAVLSASVAWLAKPNMAAMSTTSGRLHVVAAENFWGNIANQLGAGHVQVTSIITDPTTDPHLYESTARDASVVSSASVVIVNGLGYDDFMTKLLSASSSNGRQVLTVAAILQAPEGSNQHLWYDLPRMDQVAADISGVFIAKDPAHKGDYERSLRAFDTALQSLDGTLASIKQQYGGTPVAYTEPVPGYLLQAAGLGTRTPDGFAKSIEDGDDPSPADTNAMDALMTSRGVKLLLYNAQATSPVTEHVKALAKQAGITIIGVNEIMPSNEPSYQSWMRDEINALQSALGT